jgi:hypothetical protein
LLVLSISVAVGVDKDEEVFRPGAAETLPNHQTISGLTIGVDAYSTAEETRLPFGKLDPNDHGVLPVLVVMRNDSDQALRLDAIRVEYIRPDRRRLEAIPGDEVQYLHGVERPNSSGTNFPSPLPKIGKRKNKNPLAAFEIESRAFLAKMLPPHDSASGFFYYNTAFHPGSVLYITGIVEASTGQELFYFEVPVE